VDVVYSLTLSFAGGNGQAEVSFSATDDGILHHMIKKSPRLLPLCSLMQGLVLTHRAAVTSTVAYMMRDAVVTTDNFANVASNINSEHMRQYHINLLANLQALGNARNLQDIRSHFTSAATRPAPTISLESPQTPSASYFTDIYIHHPEFKQSRKDFELLMRTRTGKLYTLC
jgi:hypothetical protein